MPRRASAQGRDRKAGRAYDPALGIALILAGCLLSFYVVGLPLIAAGVWFWVHRRGGTTET